MLGTFLASLLLAQAAADGPTIDCTIRETGRRTHSVLCTTAARSIRGSSVRRAQTALSAHVRRHPGFAAQRPGSFVVREADGAERLVRLRWVAYGR